VIVAFEVVDRPPERFAAAISSQGPGRQPNTLDRTLGQSIRKRLPPTATALRQSRPTQTTLSGSHSRDSVSHVRPRPQIYGKYARNLAKDACFRRSHRRGRGSVKPSAQPTLVRTQHLPPRITPGLRLCVPASVSSFGWFGMLCLMSPRCIAFMQVSGGVCAGGPDGRGSVRRIHGEVPEPVRTVPGLACDLRRWTAGQAVGRGVRPRRWERCPAPQAEIVAPSVHL